MGPENATHCTLNDLLVSDYCRLCWKEISEAVGYIKLNVFFDMPL